MPPRAKTADAAEVGKRVAPLFAEMSPPVYADDIGEIRVCRIVRFNNQKRRTQLDLREILGDEEFEFDPFETREVDIQRLLKQVDLPSGEYWVDAVAKDGGGIITQSGHNILVVRDDEEEGEGDEGDGMPGQNMGPSPMLVQPHGRQDNEVTKLALQMMKEQVSATVRQPTEAIDMATKIASAFGPKEAPQQTNNFAIEQTLRDEIAAMRRKHEHDIDDIRSRADRDISAARQKADDEIREARRRADADADRAKSDAESARKRAETELEDARRRFNTEIDDLKKKSAAETEDLRRRTATEIEDLRSRSRKEEERFDKDREGYRDEIRRLRDLADRGVTESRAKFDNEIANLQRELLKLQGEHQTGELKLRQDMMQKELDLKLAQRDIEEKNKKLQEFQEAYDEEKEKEEQERAGAAGPGGMPKIPGVPDWVNGVLPMVMPMIQKMLASGQPMPQLPPEVQAMVNQAMAAQQAQQAPMGAQPLPAQPVQSVPPMPVAQPMPQRPIDTTFVAMPPDPIPESPMPVVEPPVEPAIRRSQPRINPQPTAPLVPTDIQVVDEATGQPLVAEQPFIEHSMPPEDEGEDDDGDGEDEDEFGDEGIDGDDEGYEDESDDDGESENGVDEQ